MNKPTNEVQAVEIKISYLSYKVPKFNMNSLTLSSATVKPWFPTLGLVNILKVELLLGMRILPYEYLFGEDSSWPEGR